MGQSLELLGLVETRAQLGYLDNIGVILGLYRDNGKENGNYYNELYRDYRDYNEQHPSRNSKITHWRIRHAVEVCG